jgi:hypothetical protein
MDMFDAGDLSHQGIEFSPVYLFDHTWLFIVTLEHVQLLDHRQNFLAMSDAAPEIPHSRHPISPIRRRLSEDSRL